MAFGSLTRSARGCGGRGAPAEYYDLQEVVPIFLYYVYEASSMYYKIDYVLHLISIIIVKQSAKGVLNHYSML